MAAPNSDTELRWEGEQWTFSEGIVSEPQSVLNLPEAVRSTDDVKYSLSIRGGGMDSETAVGPCASQSTGPGPHRLVAFGCPRRALGPLGLEVGYQWLLLGPLRWLSNRGQPGAGRSLFAQITPQWRSGEFFSFFGFITRASSVFGPTLYIAATAIFDTRVAVTAILLIIIAGTIVLQRVNVGEGLRVVEIENRRYEEEESEDKES